MHELGGRWEGGEWGNAWLGLMGGRVWGNAWLGQMGRREWGNAWAGGLTGGKEWMLVMNLDAVVEPWQMNPGIMVGSWQVVKREKDQTRLEARGTIRRDSTNVNCGLFEQT